MSRIVLAALFFSSVISTASSATCKKYAKAAANYTWACQDKADGSCGSTIADYTVYPYAISWSCVCKQQFSGKYNFKKKAGECKSVTYKDGFTAGYKAQPGDGCDTTANCEGNSVCTSGVCVGVANGKACTGNGECIFGSTCQNSTCKTVAADAACTVNSECGGDYMQMCNTISGKCAQRYSQSLGATVSSASLCASMEAYNSKCVAMPKPKAHGTACSNNAACFENPPSTADSFSSYGAICWCSNASSTSGTCFTYKSYADEYLSAHKAKFKCFSENKCKTKQLFPKTCVVTKCGAEMARADCAEKARNDLVVGTPASLIKQEQACMGCPASSANPSSVSCMAVVIWGLFAASLSLWT